MKATNFMKILRNFENKSTFSVLFFLTAAITSSCSKSYDLGDSNPQEVQFSDETPEWNTGIGQLVALKCGNCHVSSNLRSLFVPSNTPATIDDVGTQAFFSDQKHIDLVFDRVFSVSENPMPPTFATPFTTREVVAFKGWLEPQVSNISSLCSSYSATALSFTDVEPIYEMDCNSCHNGSSLISFKELSRSKEYRRTLLHNLLEAKMPPSNSSYLTSARGQSLVQWLCFGSDLL